MIETLKSNELGLLVTLDTRSPDSFDLRVKLCAKTFTDKLNPTRLTIYDTIYLLDLAISILLLP